MSLLMDALKKAELAKRQGSSAPTEEATAPSSGLSLEPLPMPDHGNGLAHAPSLSFEKLPAATPVEPLAEPAAVTPPPRNPFPPLPDHLESIEREFLGTLRSSPPPKPPRSAPPLDDSPMPAPAASAPPPPPARSLFTPPAPATAANKQDQAAAENLFAAKKPEAPSRRGFMFAMLGLTVVATAGIGGYFWWQLQPRSGSLLPPSPSAQTPPPKPLSPPPVAATPSAGQPAQPTPVPVAASPAPTPPSAPAATSATASSPPAVAAKAPATVPPKPDDGDAPSARPPRAEKRVTAASDGDGPVRISKTPLRVNPGLMAGYDAFTNGDLTAAQLQYERVLKAEPRNVDALHGMAAIAVRQGRNDIAEAYYQRVLEADPQDASALSALINLRGAGNGIAAESRLKSLIAANPESADAHFALGNLHARQNRWTEAQQAYFKAYSAEPDNPDILFNLAISLDHLRQNRLAAQYYQLALAAAKSRPAAFDANQASARLRALQP